MVDVNMSLAFSRGALDGLDRFVNQARKITFYYCKHGGSSRGMREFIEKHAVDFAKKHPQVVVNVEVRGNSHPFIKSEYLNGNTRTVGVKNADAKLIMHQAALLRDSSGFKMKKFKKWWHTDRPSVQGEWNPLV